MVTCTPERRLADSYPGVTVAYSAGDTLIVVRGNLGTSEQFTNTWAVRRTDPGADIADVGTALHTLYAAIAVNGQSSFCETVGASWRDLQAAEVGDFTWASIDGDDLDDLLPTECAIRVSLTASDRTRGGCFLAGMSVNSVENDGRFLASFAANIVDAVDTFRASLVSADWDLGIHSPTTETVKQAASARIGLVFDVIRRRRDNLAEAFVGVTW